METTDTRNWSWLLNAVMSIFYKAPVNEAVLYLALFKKLPDVALLHIGSFLQLKPKLKNDKSPLVPRAMMFMALRDKTSNNLYQEELLLTKFLYLVAMEGEDNQNQAEMMLQQYPNLVLRLISQQRELADAAGRHFKRPMSAYEYAFWAGDTRMCRMMEKYLNEETKTVVLEQCINIAKHGVDFIFKGELTQNSKHFNFEPLLMAYNACITTALLINAPIRNDVAWAPIDILWLNIGKELAKVPTYIAQEYCSNFTFYPLQSFIETLENPDSMRTLKFRHWGTNKYEFWFTRGAVNSNLGIGCTVFKDVHNRAMAMKERRNIELTSMDFAALSAISEIRTVSDRKQTFDNLALSFSKLDL